MHRQQQLPLESPRHSTRHQEWLDMVEMCDFPIPNQLKNWSRFFINEERFLEAAEQWLRDKLDGVQWPRIEDDVDKGMMKQGTGWSWSEWDDEDYINAYMAGPQQEQSKIGKWWSQLYSYATLPLTPKLPAPTGLSGINMATVF